MLTQISVTVGLICFTGIIGGLALFVGCSIIRDMTR